jgi:hypothetical protein
MPIPVIARAVTAVVLAATAATYIVGDLKGDYKVELVVQEATYTGTVKAAAGTAKGAFTAKFDITSPSTATADATGKTAGDSITFDAKYVDNGRNCTGTMTGKGAIEKDGSKAQGDLAINDSCGGETTGTFKLWR